MHLDSTWRLTTLDTMSECWRRVTVLKNENAKDAGSLGFLSILYLLRFSYSPSCSLSAGKEGTLRVSALCFTAPRSDQPAERPSETSHSVRQAASNPLKFNDSLSENNTAVHIGEVSLAHCERKQKDLTQLLCIFKVKDILSCMFCGSFIRWFLCGF